MRLRVTLVALLATSAALAGTAHAEFPYAPKGGPNEYGKYVTGEGETPDDLTGKRVWMYAATPEEGNVAVNADRRELNGVRGAHVVDADGPRPALGEQLGGRPEDLLAARRPVDVGVQRRIADGARRRHGTDRSREVNGG